MPSPLDADRRDVIRRWNPHLYDADRPEAGPAAAGEVPAGARG
ncbi:hypothetical protein AB0C02_21340 [Micromonospora sp. NPDC048999]